MRQALARSADPKILHWDDERDIGNGIIVTLKEGFCFYDDCGVMGFDTPQQALIGASLAKAKGGAA